MNKRILSVILALVLALSCTTPAMAATKTSTKTITFGSTDALPSSSNYSPVTIKVTNVTTKKTKDFSVDLEAGGNTYTFEGENCNVIYGKAPMTITLKPNKGEKNVGVYDWAMYADEKTYKSVKSKNKYYAFDLDKYMPDFSEKLTAKPDGAFQIADGSTQKLTKAGTYVLYVKVTDDGYDMPEGLKPVFFVVK